MMKCPVCKSVKLRKAGFQDYKNKKKQRYECKNCRKFTIRPKR